MEIKKRVIRLKHIFVMLVILALCAMFCVSFAACGEKNEEVKYDVAIRVACSDGEIYEFPVGTDEKHDELVYDDVERTYKVVQYRLKGYSDLWLDIVSPTDGKFDITYLQYIGGDNYKELDSINGINEKGNYLIQIRTAPEIMSLANFKEWSLYIEIE